MNSETKINTRLSNPFENRDPKEVWAEIKSKSRPMSDEEKQNELNDLRERTKAKRKSK